MAEQVRAERITSLGVNLGRGKFAVVDKVLLDGTVVAHKRFINQNRRSAITNEVNILQRLNHPNIIKYIGESIEGILMEYMNGFSLEWVMHSTSIFYGKEHALNWLLQISIGMEYMSEQQILHRDLKPANLLMTSDGKTIKIGDFGCAKEDGINISLVGTARYMAPEVIITGQTYSFQCDVYSLGIIMWEIFSRRIPFGNATSMNIWDAVCAGKRPALFKRCSVSIENLMKSCWDQAPQNRPPITEVKNRLHYLCERSENKPMALELDVIYHSPPKLQAYVDLSTLMAPVKEKSAAVQEVENEEEIAEADAAESENTEDATNETEDSTKETAESEAIAPEETADEESAELEESQAKDETADEKEESMETAIEVNPDAATEDDKEPESEEIAETKETKDAEESSAPVEEAASQESASQVEEPSSQTEESKDSQESEETKEESSSKDDTDEKDTNDEEK